MNPRRLAQLTSKVFETLRYEGTGGLVRKVSRFVLKRTYYRVVKPKPTAQSQDLLFVVGCALNHPKRYRVDYVREQLAASGVTTGEVWYENVNEDLLKYYRGFVLFRCPHTPDLERFVREGRALHKRFFYDVDDLVISETYVRGLQALAQMKDDAREQYLEGVRRHEKMLRLCDAGITTTQALAEEMKKFLPEVFVCRNRTGSKLEELSEKAFLNRVNRDAGKTVLGYFSGSITHNPDLEMIAPALAQAMKEDASLHLMLVGLIDLPVSLHSVQDRILQKPFVPWEKLPVLLSQIDVNLAPVEDTLFNRAKSENKWVEAAWVRVPTIASRCGAFEEVVQSGKTGILCDNSKESWKDAILQLSQNQALRKTLAENAYLQVSKQYKARCENVELKQYIFKKLPKRLGFVVPSTGISGGLNVIYRHAAILQKQGIDVSLISEEWPDQSIELGAQRLPVLSLEKIKTIRSYDHLVATLWSTVYFAAKAEGSPRLSYLVQGAEADFYPEGDPRRAQAEATYRRKEFQCLTISQWCDRWLREKYGQHPKYCPNGIDLELFRSVKRDYTGKVIVVIEGNSRNPQKNVDESFKICEGLNRSRFEIWYLSSDAGPKKWYVYDRFFNRLDQRAVAEVYQQAHILLKSSVWESFSYPPLEMMATGGIAIVAQNEGNAEYLRHRENAMVYQVGNVQQAQEHILEVASNSELRKILINEGLKTAQSRDWKLLESQILDLYR